MNYPDRQDGRHNFSRGLLIAGHLVMPHTHALPDIHSFQLPSPIVQPYHSDVFSMVDYGGEQNHSEHDLRRPGRMRGARLPSTDNQEGPASSERHGFPRRKSRETRGLDTQHIGQEWGVFSTNESDGDHRRAPTNDIGEHAKGLAKAFSLYGGAIQAELSGGERPGRMRQFGKIEYDLRHFDSLPADRQQEVGRSVIKILADVPPAPDGWIPEASTDAEQERINVALMVLAEAGLATVALGFVYQVGKQRRKALPTLFALAALASACGGNVAETATAVFSGGQQTTEQAPTPTQISTPEASATTELFGSGGESQTCEAAAQTFLAPRMSPEGAKVPEGSMIQHSPDPNKWTEDEKRALVDSNGNSIAPLIDDLKDQIEAIDPSVRAVAVWSSSEGYVLQLQKNGKDVWAVARNGLLQYRPDLLVDNVSGITEGDTDEFRILPDPPVDGEKRYVVTGGCGVLGVFDKKGNMIAMYKPLTDEWEMLAAATATPLPPSETPEPSATAELSAGQNIDAMLDAAAPNGLAESRVPTNAGDMTFTFQMDEEGGPWETLSLPQGQLDDINRYLLAKLAILQAKYGDHPEDYPEMAEFPNTNNVSDYVREGLVRVDARFADGKPYTAGILSYKQKNIYDFYPENGGLDPNQPIYGFNLAQISLGEFNDMQQMLRDNKIPFVRANYRPGASSEGHTETEWEVIAFVANNDGENPVLTLVAHSEHTSGLLNPSLEKAYQYFLDKNPTKIEEGQVDAVLINTLEPFKAKTEGAPDLSLLLFHWIPSK